ncbi:MAG: formylglycine-generating enzyme family protein [Balneolaceae bacterium]
MQAKNLIPRIRLALPVMLVMIMTSAAAEAQMNRADRVWIPEGSYHSVFPETKGEPVPVDSFMLEVFPVTNEQFLAFLENHPEWRKSQVPAVFAGPDYLRHWSSDLKPGSSPASQKDRPVTRVSWFAANAYCKAQNGRLPTLAEWEYAAMAMKMNSSQEWESFGSKLISWYSSVDASDPKPVGSTGIENRYGVQDLHGLVMEWVEDFRPPVADAISIDCGTAGRLEGDGTLYNYARVIRTLTRMSFKPQTSTGLIGFRCAYDTPIVNMQTEQMP